MSRILVVIEQRAGKIARINSGSPLGRATPRSVSFHHRRHPRCAN